VIEVLGAAVPGSCRKEYEARGKIALLVIAFSSPWLLLTIDASIIVGFGRRSTDRRHHAAQVSLVVSRAVLRSGAGRELGSLSAVATPNNSAVIPSVLLVGVAHSLSDVLGTHPAMVIAVIAVKGSINAWKGEHVAYPSPQ